MTNYFVTLQDGPPVNRHKPSVDVLFRSAANAAGINVLGILLTGMGDDGARGLLDLRKSGAFTVAQDRDTSVVFGMPGVAVEIGAVDRISPLERIPGLILGHQQRFLKQPA
jgi:two-component system chemotaxis response regulator CheB